MLAAIENFFEAYPWALILAAVWTIPWKGMALWKAARKRSVAWFIVLLLLNTLGILDILYLVFSKKDLSSIPPDRTAERKLEKRVLDIKQNP